MSEPALQLTTPIGGVPHDKILDVWGKVEPMLKRAITPDTGFTAYHVLMELQSRQTQLWVIGDFDAVFTTKILSRPMDQVLWVQFMAGENLDQWYADMIELLESYAKAHYCAGIEWTGRMGWQRFFKTHKEHGFNGAMVTIRKDLNHGNG